VLRFLDKKATGGFLGIENGIAGSVLFESDGAAFCRRLVSVFSPTSGSTHWQDVTGSWD